MKPLTCCLASRTPLHSSPSHRPYDLFAFHAYRDPINFDTAEVDFINRWDESLLLAPALKLMVPSFLVGPGI